MATFGPNVTVAILAGGLGTRLRPALPHCPKVLAPVRGRPFLTYLLDSLKDAGIGEVTVLTGYGAQQVQDSLGDTYGGLRLVYSPEPLPLGTAGALRWALPRLAGRTILLLNGDSFCRVDWSAFEQCHRHKVAAISLVLARVADASRFGQAEMGPDGRVLSFQEKANRDSKKANAFSGGERRGVSPPWTWVNAGIYLLDRTLIEGIPAGKPLSLEHDLLPALAAQGQVHGFEASGPLLDIGTPESYAEAERFFSRGSCPAGDIILLAGKYP
jgi:D-glycero-alpha-D-manno-heptose 1-phosphate guanylyltransferase